jgi:TonB family protein
MIASWMLYAVAVGALMTVAALGLDRVAVARRRPTRIVWVTALSLAIVLPVGRAAARLAPEPTAAVRVIPFTITVQSPAMTARASLWNRETVDRALMVGWCLLSALLLLRLTRSVLTLRRTRGTWSSTDIDGTSVRLSKNVGPAVIGLRSMDVVLPEWILSLDAPLRAIVLRHEEEHRSARDPYLLFGAAIAVALMPWNAALWFQARRLRLAIELDCDARVLRAHPSTERYGMLMLTIAQRRSVGATLFSPMLTEPATLLERRIIAMRPSTRRLARVTIYGGSALAVAALAFACSLQSDTTSPKAAPIAVTDHQTFQEFQVEKPAALLPGNVAPAYPQQLRLANVEGKLLTRFVVDTTGRPIVETVRVVERSDDRFVPSVREAIPNLRFSPADVGGKKVKQLVEMPFTFTLNKDAADGSNTSVDFSVRQIQPRKAGATVGSVPSSGPRPTLPKDVYFDYQVERPASPLPGNTSPRYPTELRKANVEGEVMAQFIVNEGGLVDSATFLVVRATNEGFANAVRASVSSLRFSPALVGGHPVKQLVQMPFRFDLTK